MKKLLLAALMLLAAGRVAGQELRAVGGGATFPKTCVSSSRLVDVWILTPPAAATGVYACMSDQKSWTKLSTSASSASTWTTPRLLAGNSVNGSANVPFSNKFIVQGTADSGLSASQFLGALGTGILKSTTTSGVVSIAVAGDFPTLNQPTTANAGTATALAANGTNCSGNQKAAGVDASGNAEVCTDIAYINVTGTPPDTTNAANITSGTLPVGRLPAFSGDFTTVAGASLGTLATVNGSPGTIGDASHASQITTNGKGLVTANTSIAIAIDASAVTSGTSTVPRGGTGAGSFTPFAPLAGGTTSTAPFQSIGTGTLGQLLFSQGSAALNQWATRSVNTSSPLSGGGSIGADLTLACATCATTTNGGPLTATTPITISAGGVIACPTCSTAAAAQSVRVVSQFDKTTDTTLADVPGLIANVTAGTSYMFRAVLNITADSAGLAQEAINGTCTGSPIWYIVKANGNATFRSGKTATQGAGIAQVVSFNTVEIEGTVTVTVTGTLTVQFAQSVAVGTSSVLVGSSFIVTPASN